MQVLNYQLIIERIAMYALLVVLLLFLKDLTNCAIVERVHERQLIEAKTRIELQSIEVDTALNQIIKLTPPILGIPEISVVELIKPDGEVFSLNDNVTSTIKPFITQFGKGKSKGSHITTKYNKIENPYHILDLKKNTSFDGLVIGPLLPEDHGNWALSAFFKDIDGKWVEMFQVITIRITESVPIDPKKAIRRIKEHFRLEFAYPIKGLETCQLISPPKSRNDAIHRDLDALNSCAYVVKDLSKDDEGIWKIIGVGKIVYRGEMTLKILDQKHVKL